MHWPVCFAVLLAIISILVDLRLFVSIKFLSYTPYFKDIVFKMKKQIIKNSSPMFSFTNSDVQEDPKPFWGGKPRFPRIPRPRIPFPRIPKPRIPLPRIPKPRIPLPRIPKPRIPLPRIPKPRIPLPRIPKPRIPLPRIPKPRIPLPRIPKPRFPWGKRK